MQPARFGGYEYGPAELAEVGLNSAAVRQHRWCGTLASASVNDVVLPLQAQQEVGTIRIICCRFVHA
jgi:3-hydroxy-9,10-secoandrosta-1,3,5(10)-triene-9,17-dione monooxygenase